jgi:hypothetical protein
MYINHVRFKRVLLITFAAITLIIFVMPVALRQIALRKGLDKLSTVTGNHELVLHVDGSGFKGLRTLYFRGLRIRDEKSENEIFAKDVSVRIRIIPLIFKKIRVSNFECKSVMFRYASVISPELGSNSLPGDSALTDYNFQNINLAEFANKNIRRFFGYVPNAAIVNRAEIILSCEGKTTVISLNGLHLKKGNFSAQIIVKGDGKAVDIQLNGKLNRKNSVVEMQMTNNSGHILPVPFVRDKYGVAAGFDSLKISLIIADRTHRMVNASGTFSITGLRLTGDRISTTEIDIDHIKTEFLIHVAPKQMEWDSVSNVSLNNISFKPFASINLLNNEPDIQFKILPVDWAAGNFFNSLPKGMFTSLDGLKAQGRLHYYLNFSVNLHKPDVLLFDTKLSASDFHLIQYGIDNYTILNSSFEHKIYEKGVLKTSFEVGPANDNFVPFESISPFLIASVMTSEDGGFFFHKGFNPEAFRESIAANIREKRFARGGSTISMQLVKNVFLTRNKTIARKIEEALIVWLIENEKLVSKQRMYEVYLNIIEWGPDIYGINQASHFYFNKKPADLNLTESIFLASIIPHPKWYKYTFENNGITKPFFVNFFQRMTELMIKHGRITPSDTTGISPMIMLNGPASYIFSTTDPSNTDTISNNDLKFMQTF